MVGTLTVARQQMVEIAKALSFDSRVLIMDEPTSALNDAEIAELFRIIRELKSRGVGIIYISHKMDELKQIADRVTVMRDGEYVATVAAADTSVEAIIGMMVGRTLTDVAPSHSARTRARSRSKSRHLNAGPLVRDVSFTLRKGEILGFAGLDGRWPHRGRASGVRRRSDRIGRDRRERREGVDPARPSDAVARGIGYLSEDRKRFGLATGMDVESNIVMSNLRKFLAFNFFLRTRADTRHGEPFHQPACHSHAVGDAAGAAAVGRQSAEDRHREVAGARLRHALLRRADARHRRRRQERNLQAAALARRRRARRSS